LNLQIFTVPENALSLQEDSIQGPPGLRSYCAIIGDLLIRSHLSQEILSVRLVQQYKKATLIDEGLGLIGRERAVACWAVVLVEEKGRKKR